MWHLLGGDHPHLTIRNCSFQNGGNPNAEITILVTDEGRLVCGMCETVVQDLGCPLVAFVKFEILADLRQRWTSWQTPYEHKFHECGEDFFNWEEVEKLLKSNGDILMIPGRMVMDVDEC